MGHAHLDNLEVFFVRRLYAKGKLSIRAAQEAASKAHETLRASEGEYTEDYMIRMGLEDVVYFLAVLYNPPRLFKRGKAKSLGPIIEPVEPLTEEQQAILDEWRADVAYCDWGCGEDGNGGQYGILDSILWKFGPGWRKQYPDGIPAIGTVTH
jgi:hypothetical protein